MVSITSTLVVDDVGNTVTVTCVIRGDPLSTTTWTKVQGPTGATITDDVSTQFSNSTITYLANSLTIASTISNDYGLYRCIGTNSLGSASAEVWLYFNGKDFFSFS